MGSNSMSEGLQLQGVLLSVVCRKMLVQDYDCAETVTGGQHETLSVRGPEKSGSAARHSRE